MLKTVGFLLGAVTAAVAQEPLPWTWCELPSASATVLAVRWHSGFHLDASGECGASRVLAECRLQRARIAVPGVRASGIRVSGNDAICFVLTEAADWQLAQRFCEHLLDDTMPVDDDTVDLAIARAALDADDAEWLYPGQMLACLARAELFAGTPAAHGVAGHAPSIQRLSRERVRELLQVPAASQGLGLGHLPPALRQVFAGRFRRGTVAALPPLAPVASPSARPLQTRVQVRAKAPFVGVAFSLPAGIDGPALAIGLEVARARAARTLPPVPEELLARAARVQWSWSEGDPVVVFCLRAGPGRSVEGPRAGLEKLLADLREAPPTAEECTAAAAGLQAQLGLPPWSEAQQRLLAALPEALPGRATTMLLAGARGLDPKGLAGLDPAVVHRALLATLAEDRAFWAAVVPAESVRPLLPGAQR